MPVGRQARHVKGAVRSRSLNEPVRNASIVPEHLLTVVENATNGFRHNEVIVQARLQNFLVADTILLAAWATLYEGTPYTERAWVLFFLALLSSVLCFYFTVLGRRHCQFLDLQMDIVCSLESRLPEEFRVTLPVKQLQDNNKELPLKCSKRIEWWRRPPRNYVKLSLLEHRLASRNLLWLVPATFGGVSAVLLGIAIINVGIAIINGG